MKPNTSYKGNSQLKKHEVEQEYTKEEIEEFIKCAIDITHFAQNYVKIVHPDRGLIPLDLYPFQTKMLEHLNDNRNSILLAARQCGKCLTSKTLLRVRENDKSLDVAKKEVTGNFDMTIEDLYNYYLKGEHNEKS